MTVEATKNSFGKYKIVEPCTVSERRPVPSYVPKPSYAESSIPRESPKFPEIKDSYQIECMKHSCILAKRILNQIPSLIKVIFWKIKLLKSFRYTTSIKNIEVLKTQWKFSFKAVGPHSGQNSQKAGHNSLISLFRDEYSHWGVFGVAVIMNLIFVFRKTKWRIQNGGQLTQISIIYRKKMTHGFLGSLIMNLILIFQKQNGVFKMADDFRG